MDGGCGSGGWAIGFGVVLAAELDREDGSWAGRFSDGIESVLRCMCKGLKWEISGRKFRVHRTGFGVRA